MHEVRAGVSSSPIGVPTNVFDTSASTTTVRLSGEIDIFSSAALRERLRGELRVGCLCFTFAPSSASSEEALYKRFRTLL
ncbi:hypothetical protein [Nonomuraea dietziae]|uniref:hypothetical protein n=1 Tax=Nonomuraea dietziae TaxID=65515 RepID=UPI003426B85C